MKITDRLVLKDKTSEKTLRQLSDALDHLDASPTLSKVHFMETHFLMLELLVSAFKRLDDNSSPAKTLLDFTGREVQDACLRVGPSQVFENDSDYVIAVMQELTK